MPLIHIRVTDSTVLLMAGHVKDVEWELSSHLLCLGFYHVIGLSNTAEIQLLAKC